MGIRKLILIIISCLFFVTLGNTQNLSNMKDLADLQFKHKKYKEAIENLLKLQKDKPNSIDIKYMLGVCYMHVGQVQNAEQYLLFAANTKGGEVEAWYWLGRLYHWRSEFKEAIPYYKQYVKEGNNRRLKQEAKHFIRQCARAREIKYQDELAIVDNLGRGVNGHMDDYAPMISPGRQNTIYFSSCRIGNSGGMRDMEGIEDDILGNYNSDIFSSQLINGEWTATRPLNNLINSSKNDEVIGFSNNSTVMYYYKGYISTKDGAIYTDTLKNNTEEVIFPNEYKSPVKVRSGDETPHFFNDSILIYASRMEGGEGGLDLYVTRKLPGGFWTRPENLGPEINTPYDEKCPFLAKNGRTLYYSSNQPKSLGGYDIFRATFRDDIYQWTQPENLGAPINSPGNDLYFSLAKDGLKSFLSSDRIGGAGGTDIYVGYFKSVQKEQLRPSNPVAFNLIDKSKVKTSIVDKPNVGTNPNPNPTPVSQPQNILFSPMFYEGDNIVTKVNMVELNKVVKVATSNPLVRVELAGHTDDADPEKFRLYFSYLRAEKAAAYLRKNGVKSSNIIVKGLGSNYPVSRNKNPDGSTSVNGRKMNRRIEIRLLDIEGSGISFSTKWPVINERLRVYDRNTYDNSLKGLSYKVQISAQKSMYDSDLIVKYKDSMIEHDNRRNLLRYTLGIYKTYSSARQLRKELGIKGINNAFIVPYIDGVRLDPSLAESFAPKYPDLNNFIQGW